MFINSVHICLCQEEQTNHLQINKKKKKHVYRDVYYLSDCSLKKIVQNYVATALIKFAQASTSYRRLLMFLVSMLNYRILIVQKENYIVS